MKEEREIHTVGCEVGFKTISNNATKISMKVNPLKTQLLCISANPFYNLSAHLLTQNGCVDNQDDMILLGYCFSNPSEPENVRI